jgi:quinol monooxygenase YgiN
MKTKKIHRQVRMYFKPEHIDTFLNVFQSSKEAIRAFPGCLSLQLIRDKENPNCLGTSSIWESSEHLNQYRESILFQETWSKTKVLFSERPQAQSWELLDWLP